MSGLTSYQAYHLVCGAILDEDTDDIELFLPKLKGGLAEDALTIAVELDRAEIVTYMVSHGVRVKDDAILGALMAGRFVMADYLFEHYLRECGNLGCMVGMTHSIARKGGAGSEAAVEYMLKKFDRINTSDICRAAVLHGHYELASRIIDIGRTLPGDRLVDTSISIELASRLNPSTVADQTSSTSDARG